MSFCLAVVVLVYTLTLTPSAQLHFGETVSFARDKSEYQSAADEIISRRFQNRFKSSFDEVAVQNELSKRFPELSSVEVKTNPFSHKPQVYVGYAKPTLLLSSGSSIYVIDQSGVAIFDTMNKSEGNTIDTSSLSLLQDQTGLGLEVGKPALTEEQIAYIYEIKQQAEAKNLQIESMIMKSGGGELEVRFGGLPYVVKYNFFENPSVSFGAFFAMKEKAQNENIKISEYIDVRVSERAYIK
jgi:hypothetical protein